MPEVTVWKAESRTPHIWHAQWGDLNLTIDLHHGVYTGRISAPRQSSTQVHGGTFAEVEGKLRAIAVGEFHG
jgi:hypothetical protein